MKSISLISLLFLPVWSTAQALYNNGATLNIGSGTTLFVVGNLTNDGAASISNSGTLNISGDLLNNGTTATGASSNLTFSGTAVQTVSGTGTVLARDITFSNAAGVVLSAPLQADGIVNFTNGLVTNLASTPLIITANGSVTGASNASHVDGYVRKLGTGAFTFPVGNATNYQPVGVNLTTNTSGLMAKYAVGDAGSAAFGTGGTSSTPLLYYNQGEYWDLSPTGTASGSVTIYFDTYKNIGITNTAHLRVAHKSGGQWLNEGATSVSGTVTSGSVTGNSVNTWSPFSLGSISAASPLPVTLISFSGNNTSGSNHLSWQSGTENPGIVFNLQRSGEGTMFQSLGTVSGRGANSTYSFTDQQPGKLAYYRLEIVEAGQISYSQTIALRSDKSGVGQVSVFPVPASLSVKVTATGSALRGSTARVLNMTGQQVMSFVLQTEQTIDVRSWPGGTYWLYLEDGTTLQLIRQ